MIKLYGIPRSRAMRPLWMLEELGLPYEQVKVSFVNDTRKPEFLRLNPNGHIPVLQDGDLVLWESLAINLYLARKYDKGLWPKRVEDEGRAFQWSLWSPRSSIAWSSPRISATRRRPPTQPSASSSRSASSMARSPAGTTCSGAPSRSPT